MSLCGEIPGGKSGCRAGVRETEGPEAIILELNVAPEDMGKVIGKQGRIAKAIRSVLKAATAQGQQACFS